MVPERSDPEPEILLSEQVARRHTWSFKFRFRLKQKT